MFECWPNGTDNELRERNDLLDMNSLGFIEKTLEMFDPYESIALYLDNWTCRKKCRIKIMMQQQFKMYRRSTLDENYIKKIMDGWTAQKK